MLVDPLTVAVAAALGPDAPVTRDEARPATSDDDLTSLVVAVVEDATPATPVQHPYDAETQDYSVPEDETNSDVVLDPPAAPLPVLTEADVHARADAASTTVETQTSPPPSPTRTPPPGVYACGECERLSRVLIQRCCCR